MFEPPCERYFVGFIGREIRKTEDIRYMGRGGEVAMSRKATAPLFFSACTGGSKGTSEV